MVALRLHSLPTFLVFIVFFSSSHDSFSSLFSFLRCPLASRRLASHVTLRVCPASTSLGLQEFLMCYGIQSVSTINTPSCDGGTAMSSCCKAKPMLPSKFDSRLLVSNWFFHHSSAQHSDQKQVALSVKQVSQMWHYMAWALLSMTGKQDLSFHHPRKQVSNDLILKMISMRQALEYEVGVVLVVVTWW